MNRPRKYLQTDPRWSGNNYSAGGDGSTIGTAGCGPTSAAMVIATWRDANVTPAHTAAWAKANGYKAPNQGTYYSYFAPQLAKFGIQCKQLNYANLRNMAAIENGLNASQLYQWVQKYKIEGYNGLVNKKNGRPAKEPQMKTKATPAPLTESEREELIRLRAENEYIKAEIEVIKKEIALRHEKWAAELKAKKQRSSKNSEKKDTN